ncbi:MAG: efflux RND transporter periplasmic adaptor subunit [Candidatus Palauibacterales bacterium]|nr:efflux RND transporter periplasmic adaptor subunit [Candidatus Palauibacterales bacterium]
MKLMDMHLPAIGAPTRIELAGLAALAAALLMSGCGNGDEDAAAAMDMTPEEHAMMQAGGSQGTMDSTGAMVRQPVHLTTAQEHALGVVYTTVGERSLEHTIRTVGRVVAAEDRVAEVTLKVEGFVESLSVNTTGEAVRRGQALLTLYSPDLVAAQEELLTAKRLAGRVDEAAEEAWMSAQTMLAAARRRLSYWDITNEQIERLERTGEVSKTMALVSPVNGIVLEKSVLEGQRVSPGTLLYRIADLSEVWVEGDVFEQDLQFIQTDAQAHIEVAAYPGEHRMGRVSFVYPTVDVASRTNRVRVTLQNPDLRLKPGMFATMFFDTRLPETTVIPLEAVLVTGERNLVFVREADGMLQPREVVLGPQAGDYVQILAGLEPGETIVGSANFLVDAESRLASTGGGMPGMQHGAVDIQQAQPGDTARPAEHQHD